MAIAYLTLSAVGVATALFCGGPYWASPGASVGDFTAQAFVNNPSSTLGADLVVVYVAVNLWLVVEGRRLGMKHLWLYLLLNTVIAVAAGWALFLAMREREPEPGPPVANPVLSFVYFALSAAGIATLVIWGLPCIASGAGLADFVRQAFVNGPAATLSIDLLVCWAIANLWMLTEGRRLGMGRLWIYVLLDTAVALAAGLAGFLAIRARSGPRR